MTRAIRNILHGPLPEKWASLADASNLWRKLPYALLLASLLVFGFFPRLLTEKIKPDAQKIVRMAMAATVRQSWRRPTTWPRDAANDAAPQSEIRNPQSEIDERFLDDVWKSA